MNASHTGDTKHEYLVTQSLYDHLSAFKRSGLSIPSRESIQHVEDKLLDNIRAFFKDKDVTVESLPFQDLCDGIVSLTHEVSSAYRNPLVLSTAPLLTAVTGGECIEMNRLVDLNGEILSIGPRPGNPSIHTQIVEIEKKLSDRPVILVEDGSFTGGTLKFILDELKHHPVKVVVIVLGVLFPKAERALKGWFAGEVHCYKRLNQPIDWMPSHDFFPFVPNSGRVIGTKLGKSVFPVYLHNGASLSMPYIMPYGNPAKWASLEGSGQQVAEFSMGCLDSIQNIFCEIQRLNKREIVVGDLLNSYPATSIPISGGEGPSEFTGLMEKVVDIIQEDKICLS